jgi:hypothetical protein
MIADERWNENWVAVSRPGSVRVDLGLSRAKRRAAERAIRALPPGTPVVVAASPLGALRRKRFASKAGLALEHEYLVFPSARAPAYMVEDARGPIRFFLAGVLVTPPRTRTRFSTPIGAVLFLLRAFKPWRLVRVAAPGRLLVATRT